MEINKLMDYLEGIQQAFTHPKSQKPTIHHMSPSEIWGDGTLRGEPINFKIEFKEMQ